MTAFRENAHLLFTRSIIQTIQLFNWIHFALFLELVLAYYRNINAFEPNIIPGLLFRSDSRVARENLWNRAVSLAFDAARESRAPRGRIFLGRENLRTYILEGA